MPVQSSIRINAGGAAFTDSLNRPWDGDKDFTGGSDISTATDITSSLPGFVIPPSDQTLYKSQKAGSSLTFSAPITNGNYTLTLFFAEIEGKTAGQRKFDVKVENKTVLTDFDIAAVAGGINKGMTRRFPVTVSDGKLDIAFTGKVGNAAVAGVLIEIPSFSAVTGATVDNPLTLPGVLEAAIPVNTGGGSGIGPSSAESVALPTGVKEFQSGADISVRNPVGPGVSFSRRYRSALAVAGVSSPGLSPGWVHNYDLRVQPDASGRGVLRLTYPGGGYERWSPVLDAGNPTGAFTIPPFSPYVVTGVAGSLAGDWQSLTMMFGDRSKQVFTKQGGLYRLTEETSATGRKITFSYDAEGRLTDIKNDDAPPATLLSFAYQGGLLQTVTDKTVAGQDRQITYTFGGGNLTQVSLPNTPGVVAWEYGYQAIGGKSFLNAVMAANPAGVGVTPATATKYDDQGRVSEHTNADGVKTAYIYNGNGSTTVTNFDKNGTPLFTRTEWFDFEGKSEGTEVTGQRSFVENQGPLIGSVTNLLGQKLQFSHNAMGKISLVVNSRGVATTLTYEFPAGFTLGLLTQIQTGMQTPTKLEYFLTDNPAAGQFAGLLKKTSTPVPGAASGAAQWIDTTLTYTPLGNIKTITTPAVNGSVVATATKTYEYAVANDPLDGYTKAETLSEPVSVTDPLGNVTKFRYDSAGRLVATIDALGHRTDYNYNTYGQLSEILAPPTNSATPNLRAKSVYVYHRPQAPAFSVQVFDENGSSGPVLLLNRTNTEGAGTGGVVEGSTQKLDTPRDDLLRLRELVDGNDHAKQQFAYNTQGYLSGVSYPVGNGVELTFDANGNVSRLKRGADEFVYARAGDDSRLTQATLPGGLGSVTLDYDELSRVIKRTDATGVEEYAYDDLNNILSVKTTFPGLSPQTVSYVYYPDGSVKSVTTPGGTFSYYYDLNGQLLALQLGNAFDSFFPGAKIQCQYDKLGRPTRQLQTSGILTYYIYNSRGQLTKLLNLSSKPITGYPPSALEPDVLTPTQMRPLLSKYDLQYNGLGQPTQIDVNIAPVYLLKNGTEYAGSVKLPSARGIRAYRYSPWGDLLEEDSTLSDEPVHNGRYTHSFLYDNAGNPTTFRGATLGYNAGDQITSETYDGNGNQMSLPGVMLEFDARSQLKNYPGLFSAVYSAGGLRAWKEKASGGERTYFLYDKSGDVLCELNTQGAPASTYLRGPCGLAFRYRHGLTNPVMSYTFDPEGNLVQRHRQNDQFVLSADTVIYDLHGELCADTDALDRIPYPSPDSVGFGGQWGTYTDLETIDIAGRTYLALLSGQNVHYNPRTGHTMMPSDDASTISRYYPKPNPIARMVAITLAGVGGTILTRSPLGGAAAVGAVAGLYNYEETLDANEAAKQALIAGVTDYVAGKVIGTASDAIISRLLRGSANKGGGFGLFGITGKLVPPTIGENSPELMGLYLQEVQSPVFKAKLALFNSAMRLRYGRGYNPVWASEIRSEMEQNAVFVASSYTKSSLWTAEVAATRGVTVGKPWLINGITANSYLNRSTTHHEMLHMIQYLRVGRSIHGWQYEVGPSIIGTPEYGVPAAGVFATVVYGAGYTGYWTLYPFFHRD